MMEKTSVPYDTISMNSVSTEPMFSKCCCCIPLRIGCFILGYMNLFITSLHTLQVFAVILYCMIKNHGFEHIDQSVSIDSQTEIGVDSMMLDCKPIIGLGWILVFIILFDLVWVVINVLCLVGIHKKRPGHIRTYVGFSTFRLLIAMAGYMYRIHYVQSGNPHIIMHCIDIGLSGYFILVYYIYAMKLDKEAREAAQTPQTPQTQAINVSYIYPTKLDTKHLLV